MNKEEIIKEIKIYYPPSNKEGNLSAIDCYDTPEIKKLQALLKKRYDENDWFLNVPKWFVSKKWPKPIFTRQANVQDPMWPYFSIWIHDMANGEHYTISSSHIIPFFLVYKWKNTTIPEKGLDYIGEAVDRKKYFNNLTFMDIILKK